MIFLVIILLIRLIINTALKLYIPLLILNSLIDLIVILYIFTYILKPIKQIVKAIKTIDFEQDKIDFTKLDNLKPFRFHNLNIILQKFKYLADIIIARVDTINRETIKSETDTLTGCFNRTRLDKYKYTYSNYAILFIDVNNLKKMNDTFGHEAGDSLLKTASNKIKYWSKFGDVYRIGGDEFMIVVTANINLYTEINAWYPTIGQLNRATDGFVCGLAYGVAFSNEGSFDRVMELADERMYDMKVAMKAVRS